jgi:hypothetical protein
MKLDDLGVPLFQEPLKCLLRKRIPGGIPEKPSHMFLKGRLAEHPGVAQFVDRKSKTLSFFQLVAL